MKTSPRSKNQKPILRSQSQRGELAAQQTLRDIGSVRVPIPVEQIAQQLGLQVDRGRLGEDISGLLVISDGRGTIGVNADHAPTRQRFTIAHEIGHYVMHRQEMRVFIDHQFFTPYLAAFRDVSSSTGNDRLERDANAFAAALLMPADLLAEAIGALDTEVTDDEAIETLAARFHVSKQAMTIRLVNLDDDKSRLGVG